MTLSQTDGPTHPTLPESGGIWVSITDLAKLKGSSKQAISSRVAQLVDAGRLATRPQGIGRPTLVNVADYDRAVAETGFLPQQQAADTMRARRAEVQIANPDEDDAETPDVPRAAADPTLTQAQTRKALAEAELKTHDLAERRKLTVPVAGPRGVEAAMARAGACFVQALERLASRSGDLLTAFQQEGAHGHRRLLMRLVSEVRITVADELKLLRAEGIAEEVAGPYEAELAPEEPAS